MSANERLAQIDDDLSRDSAANTNSERPATSNRKIDNQDDARSKSTVSTHEDDDTDSNASSEYEVEKIVAKRRRRRRRNEFEYYIKWVGYDDSANEWIPEADLNCPERLAEFEREEERKRNQSVKQKQRQSSQKRRISNPSNLKRTKVIEDDEDEDDASSQASSVLSTQLSNNKPSVAASKKRIPASVSYGVDRGFKVQAVLGINHQQDNQLYYLVHYVPPTTIEDDMELLPATVARVHCEEEIIQFFESRIAWNNHPKDR